MHTHTHPLCELHWYHLQPSMTCRTHCPSLQVVGQGKAILGYTIVGHVALLLLAEKIRVSATLPGGHEVKTVTTTRWHRMTLLVRAKQTPMTFA